MAADSDRDQSVDRLLKGALRHDATAAGGPCLDAETLAAWADGALPAADVTRVEAHLSTCARCQTVLAVFAKSDTVPAVPVIPFRPRSSMRWWLPLAAGTIAATLLVWTAWPRRASPQPPDQAMARAEPSVAPPAASRESPASPRQLPVMPAAPLADAARSEGKLESPKPAPATTNVAADRAVSEAVQVQAEFGPPEIPSSAFGAVAKGRGGSRADTVSSVRWRVLVSGQVQRSTTGGATWDAVVLDPPAVSITGGAAPSPPVCWLVGRGGVVLLTLDGVTFTRVTFPETTNLRAVSAIDARQATVTTADGRVFATIDGGATWTPRSTPPVRRAGYFTVGASAGVLR